MIKIEYPPYHPKIKKDKEIEFIFDEIRKKWRVLTPEEWVRQNLLQYIRGVKNYPASLIAVEKTIHLGDMKKRFDIVVFDKEAQPWMLIECKEMNVVLDKTVLDQALRYNISLRVPYIVITNGTYCHAFLNENGQLSELTEFPSFGLPGSTV